MARILSVVGVTMALAVFMAPQQALSQAHDDQGHNHASAPVSCTTLAMPPWDGLPEADRAQFAVLQQQMTALSTPEAARAAGFNPALGDIPGMGVHYVNSARGRDPVNVNAPDHLMFIEEDGRQQLVGAAFAFVDVPDTDEPIPFQSDLAKWHDHPQFAGDGQTLHMLHVWFIPSSNGPFAGLNFWLPYRTAGITPPSSCWMADEADALRIQTVSFALVPPRRFARQGQPAPAPAPDRTEMLAALDVAARAVDHHAWVTAADLLIADLTENEQMRIAGLLGNLGANQMSSAERDAAGIAQPGRNRDGN